MNNKPIIIIGLPRSGTSLIAGLLHAHGVWVGEKLIGPRDMNPRGEFVNLGIDRILRESFKYENIKQYIINEITHQGYKDGLWLMKHGPDMNRCLIWQNYFDPTWIIVRRKKESILKSREAVAEKKGTPVQIDKNKFDRKYTQSIAYMKSFDGFEIWPDKIVKGDFSELQKLCEILNISFSEVKTRTFILPNYWRF